VFASQYVHPEFGFFCPAQRLRRRLRVVLACLAMAGVGAAVMAAAERPEFDAAVTHVHEASIVETVPAMRLPPFAWVGTELTGVGARTASDRSRCIGDTQSEENCVSVKLRKPRMVQVATDRPAIAAAPIGRSAIPATRVIDAAPPAASGGRQVDLAKPDQPAPAPVAAAGSTEAYQKAAATPKKAQRSANRQNPRRDHYRYGAPSWREVRVDDWAARGYALRERDYQRGGYGRGGFMPNFW
jgi:hypothetical protein